MHRCYLTPEGAATIAAENIAHRAYLEQLREERARLSYPMLMPAGEQAPTLDQADQRAHERRFTGAALTGWGGL